MIFFVKNKCFPVSKFPKFGKWKKCLEVWKVGSFKACQLFSLVTFGKFQNLRSFTMDIQDQAYEFLANIREGGFSKLSPLVAQVQREGLWSPFKDSIVPGITVVRSSSSSFSLKSQEFSLKSQEFSLKSQEISLNSQEFSLKSQEYHSYLSLIRQELF